jgi:site-specific recombinase XerD
MVIAERIDIERDETITLQDIEAAGERWARYQRRRGRAGTTRWSRQRFVQVTIDWMRFLGRLKEPYREPGAFASQLESFVAYLRDERGLSPSTIRTQRWQVDSFLKSLPVDRESLAELTIEEVDNFLSLQGKRGWGRVSVATSARALRSFFRHAETRGWCRAGIAAAINAPRLFKDEGLPIGPSWDDVQRVIATTNGSRPRDLRDHAILLLLAIYGLRSSEVKSLRPEDLDWTSETITVKRSKQRRTQHYPLEIAVGDAILQYLKQARPRSPRRELFLTLNAPFRPLSASGMYYVVSSRLAALGITVPRRGPHCLRHACASHLVAAGLSLKEIGDHLGHRSAYATRIYAKVDLAGLREVADFDWRGLMS